MLWRLWRWLGEWRVRRALLRGYDLVDWSVVARLRAQESAGDE